MSTGLALYQITDRYELALREMVDMDIPAEAIADTLEGIEGEVTEKGRNVAAFFQNLEAEAMAMKIAEERIKARRQAIENKVARMKDYLKTNMERCGITEISCPEFVVRIRKNPPRVVVDSENDIPPEFVREKVIKEIDKRALGDALKDGLDIDAAHLEVGTRLEVR